MPVIKCSNGKYRIGHSKCMYKSKASAERAYKGYLGSKYANNNISEKTELSILRDEDTTIPMCSSDLKNIMRLAGIEKSVKSQNDEPINFIGTLSNKNKYDFINSLSVDIDEDSTFTNQYNIGDEVETPYGYGIIHDILSNDSKITYLINHLNPPNEHGDPVEVNSEQIHKISETNISSGVTYFITDDIGRKALLSSELSNELKYIDDDNVIAVDDNRFNTAADIIKNANGELSLKEAADPFGGSSFSPYVNEPSDDELKYAYERAEHEVDMYFDKHEFKQLELELKDDAYDQDERNDLTHDFINDAVYNIQKSLDFDELDDMVSDKEIKELVYNKLKKLDITVESLDLSKGTYDRLIIEMIIDELKSGKTIIEIANNLSFKVNDVKIIYEHIIKIKKKI